MKKLLDSLPARLLIGVAAGIGVGLLCSGLAAGDTVMQVILTFKSLMGSLISFCVPLIIIGFIAPSITRLSANASRMLVLGGGIPDYPRPVHPVGGGRPAGPARPALQSGDRPHHVGHVRPGLLGTGGPGRRLDQG